MMRSLWISKTGMEAQQTQLDTISNNLANVSSNGYKKAHAVFEDLMYQNLRQVGGQTSDQTRLPSGLQVGTGVRVVATERMHSQGNLTKTDRAANTADVRTLTAQYDVLGRKTAELSGNASARLTGNQTQAEIDAIQFATAHQLFPKYKT